MDKDAIYLLAGVGAICWVIGGAGWKPMRRWLWPLIAATAALAFGTGYWRATLLAALMAASHHLGYSPERKSAAWIALTGLSFGLCLAPLMWPEGRHIVRAAALMLVIFCGGMLASLKWNRIPWKGIESLTGFAQGTLIAWSLLRF